MTVLFDPTGNARPTRLEQLWNFNHLSVKRIHSYMLYNDFPSVLVIAGSYGEGKTTIAKILGRHVTCGNFQYGKLMCEKCENCKRPFPPEWPNIDTFAWRRDLYIEINCGYHEPMKVGSEGMGYHSYRCQGLYVAEYMSTFDNVMAFKSRFGDKTPDRKRIIVFDEAQNMTKQLREALPKMLEGPQMEWTTCVFLTTDPKEISDAIISRAGNAIQYITPPTQQEAVVGMKKLVLETTGRTMPNHLLEQIAAKNKVHSTTLTLRKDGDGVQCRGCIVDLSFLVKRCPDHFNIKSIHDVI